ncbi:MAG TPA: type II toxin-antitoxin system RelE/ParE family toxin [Leptospiraceae bacterium]|nr:type II toxin-antitoxin system RelE/ParE family toxin [Leptospiraceae bacterium]HMW04060.1 type II toxin-antitoxin system RelE/ParE family toxin [Leptospiraceae bacterium]HMX30950.1 type II toxin-antitoxin system RelE/ParE family toxin [Leptospiraceae bacterium]HMY30054.1 type II toxin-antitoxin system RelE/ParE family toxin [Leptospiraceae bacterium]HMZ62759.1 type II toxin-antitoxin system RelE/ParE family toxin [Leptospiraceae bacterium]
MIANFGDKFTEDLFHGNTSSKTHKFPKELVEIALRKLDMLNAALNVEDLRFPPGNRLKKLKGDLKNVYSIRINDQYRITFQVLSNKFENVKIEDYH